MKVNSPPRPWASQVEDLVLLTEGPLGSCLLNWAKSWTVSVSYKARSRNISWSKYHDSPGGDLSQREYKSLTANTATIVRGSFKLFELSIFEMLRKSLSEIIRSICTSREVTDYSLIWISFEQTSVKQVIKYLWWSAFACLCTRWASSPYVTTSGRFFTHAKANIWTSL